MIIELQSRARFLQAIFGFLGGSLHPNQSPRAKAHSADPEDRPSFVSLRKGNASPASTEDFVANLLTNEKVRTVWDQANEQLYRPIIVKELSKSECAAKDVTRGRMVPIFLGRSLQTIKIYIDKTLSYEWKVKIFLVELFNALFAESYNLLGDQAASGALSKEDYVRETEQLEYNALVQSNALLREAYPGIEPWDPEMVQSFNFYLETQEENGHSAKYRKQWDRLRAV